MNARSRAIAIFRLSLGVIVGMAVGQPTGAGAEEQIVISYGAGGYRYQVVQSGKGFGFEQPEFDDTAFTPGDAGFGTPGISCELNSGDAVNTTWELGTDILVRREFEVPPDTTDLVVNVAIDNDVQVFVNGHDVSAANLESVLRTRVAADPGATIVQVRADRRLPYEDVGPVIKACRDAGLVTLRLVTEKSAGGPS